MGIEQEPGERDRRISRREVLKRGILGAAGLTVLPAVIAACGNSPKPSPAATATPPPPTPTPTPATATASPTQGPAVTLGHNYVALVDYPYRDAIAAIDKAFEAETGIAVTATPIEGHSDQFGAYFSGHPDDVTFWYSGFWMRYFARKNLLTARQGLFTAIDDVWAGVSSNYSAALAPTVTGDDGHVYAVPITSQPWLFFYRKSLWAAKGYEVPTTWTELLALCARMKKDRLTPIAFGDKDGWPATGTFDILNLRLNGYDFHMGLMTGKEKWTDSRVAAVFQTWRQLIPFFTPASTGLIWQDARSALLTKTAGMYFCGLFLTDQVDASNRPALDDLDCFPFPYFGNTYDAEKALDAPIDVLVMCSESPTLEADLPNARAYLEFWARGSTQLLWLEANADFIPTASDADTSQLDALRQEAFSITGQAGRITQLMDRDTRSDFAGPSGMQNFLIKFLDKPGQDLGQLQDSIQAFWDGLAPYG